MNLSRPFGKEGRSGTSTRGARAIRAVLVVSQVSFAFMLLIGAACSSRASIESSAWTPVLTPKQLLTARISPPGTRYADDAQVLRLHKIPARRPGRSLRDQCGTDVEHLWRRFQRQRHHGRGDQMAPGESLISRPGHVTPGYMEALKLPLRSGRFFSDATLDPPLVVIVDETLAKKFGQVRTQSGARMYKPNNPRTSTKPGPKTKWITVVGVVPETRMAGLVSSETRTGPTTFRYSDGMRQ